MMIPSREQIERAAYERWERRGRDHGGDHDDWIAAEMDQTFDLTYRTLGKYALDGVKPRLVGGERRPRCRFCEQSPPRAAFSKDRPAVPEFMGNRALLTREVCDECAGQFEGTIDRDLQTFWESLDGLRQGRGTYRGLRAPSSITIAAYKGLIRIALTIMPEAELSAFTDAIEWVGNPDHEFDSSLFGGVGCLLYHVYDPYPTPWTSLAQRIDDDEPVPSMLLFLGSGGVVIQTQVPLSSRDEDLDGAEVRILQRSFTTGSSRSLHAADCLTLPLKAADQPRPRRFRMFK